MSTLFQPTALVGAIALAMGFSTSVFAAQSQDQRVVNACFRYACRYCYTF